MKANNQDQIGCSNSAQLSWTAIFSGVLTATAVGALAALLGSAIGISLFKPDTDVIGILSIGAVVWFIITGCIAMFIGGWVSGYITPYVSCIKSSLHGFVLWSVSFLLGLVISISSTGLFLTGSAQLVGQALSLSQEMASTVAKPFTETISTSINLDNESLQKISDQVGSLIKKAKKNDKNSTINSILQGNDDKQQQLIGKLKEYFMNPDENNQPLEEQIVKLLTENTDLTQQQAENALNKWQEAYENASQQIKDKAQEMKEGLKDATESSANFLGGITFAAFLAMLFGLISAILGSCVGARYHKKHLA